MTTLTLSAGLDDAELEFAAETRSVDQLDDHALLAATRTGDEAAFQELVRRYRKAGL